MVTGCGGRPPPPVDRMTAPGITTTRAPSSIGVPVPPMTALSSITHPGPIRTSPATVADAATKASGATSGCWFAMRPLSAHRPLHPGRARGGLRLLGGAEDTLAALAGGP